MPSFVDIHQHVVYGVDDGPATLAESIRLLERDCEQGIRHVIATSHAYPAMHPFPYECYYRRLSELNQVCRTRNLPVYIYPGCEVFYSREAIRHLEERRLPTLARSRFVLLEFDPTSAMEGIESGVRETANIGLIPVVAHCERYDAFIRDPQAGAELRARYPMRLQMNCATILRRLPHPLRKARDFLLRQGVIDYIATDAHNATERPPRMMDAYRQLVATYGQRYADHATSGNGYEMGKAPLAGEGMDGELE